MKILFTAGGSPGNELIYNKLKTSHDFWFADTHRDRIAEIIPEDKQLVVPLVDNQDYFKKILEICYQKKIEILVPGIDEELLKMHELFSSNAQTDLFLPSKLFIKNMLDKYYSMKILEKFKMPVPKTLKLEEATDFKFFPLILKPRFGRGSRGIHIIKTAKELELYIKLKQINNEDYICQTYEEGQEYTVQIFNHNNKNQFFIIPLKVLLKKGVTLTAEIDFDEGVIKVCKKIAQKFKEKNIFNVQLIKSNKDNSIKIFEINPRFSTTTCILSTLGIDMFKFNNDVITETSLKTFQGLKLNRTLTNIVRLV